MTITHRPWGKRRGRGGGGGGSLNKSTCVQRLKACTEFQYKMSEMFSELPYFLEVKVLTYA